MTTTLLLQLSDLHIREPGRLAYGRINTAPYLQQAVQSITRLPQRPDAVVITGDLTQVDLPRGHKSGLAEARKILSDVRGIAMTDFLAEDVVRHPRVARIVDAYDAQRTRPVPRT